MSCPGTVNHSAFLCDTWTAAGPIAAEQVMQCRVASRKGDLDAQDAVVWNRRNTHRCCHNRVGHSHNPLAKPAADRRRGDQRFCHDDECDGPSGSAVRCVLIRARSSGQPGPAKPKPGTNVAESPISTL